MARSDVQELIRRLDDAGKPKKTAPRPVAKPKEVVKEVVKVAPVSIDLSAVTKQLKSLAEKKTNNNDIIEGLAVIAAMIDKEGGELDLSPIVKELKIISESIRNRPSYKFIVNKDRNGFTTTVDAVVVQ